MQPFKATNAIATNAICQGTIWHAHIKTQCLLTDWGALVVDGPRVGCSAACRQGASEAVAACASAHAIERSRRVGARTKYTVGRVGRGVGTLCKGSGEECVISEHVQSRLGPKFKIGPAHFQHELCARCLPMPMQAGLC